MKKYLEFLAKSGFSTVDGRISAVAGRFGYRSKVPIYLGKNILFLVIAGIRSEESLLVNFYSLKDFHHVKNGVVITFGSNHEMLFDSSRKFFEAYKKAKTVSEAIIEAKGRIESAYMDF